MDESDLALARFLRFTLVRVMDDVASAILWAAAAMFAVIIGIWVVTEDFPGRLLALNAALVAGGAYLALKADKLPLPDPWARSNAAAVADRAAE